MKYCAICGGLVFNNIHVCPCAGDWLPPIIHEEIDTGRAAADFSGDAAEGRCIDDGEL